jgi:uncharacterized tellurite resistance protein B-like protein
MFSQLRDFFAAPAATDGPDNEAALHLAAAMLLVEVAKVDGGLDGDELARMKAVLARNWGLGEQDLADLVAAARDTSDASVSLHQHIDLINGNFSPSQKNDLVRGLWEIACADEHIHHHEEALIRRLADLIYVSHTDFIRAKHLALGDA